MAWQGLTRQKRSDTHRENKFPRFNMPSFGRLETCEPVSFADWVSAPLLLPKPHPAQYHVTIDLRPSSFATKKDERVIPNMETVSLQTVDSSLFGEADLVHSYYQAEQHPDDGGKHTYIQRC